MLQNLILCSLSLRDSKRPKSTHSTRNRSSLSLLTLSQRTSHAQLLVRPLHSRSCHLAGTRQRNLRDHGRSNVSHHLAVKHLRSVNRPPHLHRLPVQPGLSSSWTSPRRHVHHRAPLRSPRRSPASYRYSRYQNLLHLLLQVRLPRHQAPPKPRSQQQPHRRRSPAARTSSPRHLHLLNRLPNSRITLPSAAPRLALLPPPSSPPKSIRPSSRPLRCVPGLYRESATPPSPAHPTLSTRPPTNPEASCPRTPPRRARWRPSPRRPRGWIGP